MAQLANAVPLATGLAESVGQVAVVAGALLLGLMFVALGTYAYKQLRGGGVEWPDEREGDEPGDSELRTGSDDDEWDYY